MVNCDKREQEYTDCLKELNAFTTVSFNSEEIVEKLEDAAEASYLPKVAVFSVAKGFDKPVCFDIKQVITKNEPGQAM